jgi:hypothetical protein
MYGSWDSKRKSKYIKSVFKGFLYTPIVVVKLTEEYRKRQNDDDIPSHLKYACLDGQHRSTVIAEFIDNKFGITCTMDLDEEGEKQYNNVLFKDLTEREQMLFLNAEVMIHEINCKDQPLQDVFLAINDGEPLNHQEKRNAVHCESSCWTRKCFRIYGEDEHSLFRRISKIRGKINRMAAHEHCSFVYLFLKNFIVQDNSPRKFTQIKPKDLDDLYTADYKLDRYITDYIEANYFNSLVPIANELKRNHNEVIKKNVLWVYTILHSLLVLEEKSSISSVYEEFTSLDLWKFSKNLHDTLMVESAKGHSRALENLERKTITEDEFKNMKFYHQCIGRAHVGGDMKYIYNKIMEKIPGPTVLETLKIYCSLKLQSQLKQAV